MLSTIVFRIITKNYNHSRQSILGLAYTIAIIFSLLSILNGLSFQISTVVNQSGSSQSITIEKNGNSFFPSTVISKNMSSNIAYVIQKSQTFQPVLINNSLIQVPYVKLNISTYLESHTDSYLIEGNLPSSSSQILIGQYLAKTLLLQSNDRLTINGTNFIISGILNDDFSLQASIISNLTPKDLVNLIEVILNNPQNGLSTLNFIKSKLDSSYNVYMTKQNQNFLLSIFNEMISKFFYIILIICFISAIRIYYTIYWIVLNHFNDLLLLRIIGVTKFQIILMGLLLSTIIGNASIILGFTIGLSLPMMMISIVAILFHLNYITFFPPLDVMLYSLILLNFFIILGSIRPLKEIIDSNLVIENFG